MAWNVHRIADSAIDCLQTEYVVNPKDLFVLIGPHIRYDDFEVEIDAVRLFEAAFPGLDHLIRQVDAKKYRVNLARAIRYTLLQRGVSDDKILEIDLSTYTEKDLLHSYRRDGEERFGLMAVVSGFQR